MEIRSVIEGRMDDSDSSPVKKTSSEECLRPISPCDSEISVGCENESGEPTAASPMDMTEDTDVETAGASPASSGSRGLPSPRSLSQSSAHDGSESFAYLSEDEYFRPLKRLAMSDTSPHPPSSTRENLSESLSSPEPSHPHPKQQRSPVHPDPVLASEQKLPEQDGIERVRHSVERITEEGDQENAEEGRRDNLLEGRRNEVDQKIPGLRSFSIMDILSYKPSRRKSSIPVKIVRPWDTREESTNHRTTPTRPSNHDHPNRNNNNTDRTNNNNNNNNNPKKVGSQNDRDSALDALYKMTNKTLDNLNKEDKADAVNLFNNRQPSKKKRKSRTAFTNHQIFELEKRFLYQKYLSPADRDELAQSLGLSNAQVITWFQNRRAKLKRDMEELKRDVETSKIIHNKSLLEAASANVVAYLKSKELPKLHLTSLSQ